MALDKNAIMAAADIPVKMVNVPEWGGDVFIKRPSIRERDILGTYTRQFLEIKPGKKGEDPKTEMIKGEEAEKAFASFRLKTVGFALCDEKGNRLFTDDEIDKHLGAKSTEAIERIFNEVGNAFMEDKA